MSLDMNDDDDRIEDPIAAIRKRDEQSMPPWFPAALIGAVAWTVFGLWLSSKAHWPEAYGITHDCALRGCIFEDIVKSPVLLQHPTTYSIALFAWFATMGAIVVAIVVHAVVRKPDFQHFAMLALIAGALVVIYLSPQSALDW